MVLVRAAHSRFMHSRNRKAPGSTDPIDSKTAARFGRQTAVFAVICAKTLSFLGSNACSKIDFGDFDPMFALNAALDRSAIPR
jgi:hypothetical protein